VTPLMRLRENKPHILPDFLTPPPTAQEMSLEEELEAVLSTPAWRIETDLDLWRKSAPKPYQGLLVNRGEETKLVSGLRSFYHSLIAPDWPAIRQLLREEIEARSMDLGCYGVDHVLATLHPRLAWEHPVLTLKAASVQPTVEVNLNGRGLILVPSAYWRSTFATKLNAWDPLVVVYPLKVHHRGQGPIPARRDALSDLMGRTRTSVLVTLLSSPGLSTSALAQVCGISAASASEHARALRRAGLLSTTRRGRQVEHELSNLGRRLVERGH
jgi:DNA-binding transcriptional ArsR family regulator